MKTSRSLTLAQLVAANACKHQRNLFAKLFGESVEVTEALCVEHVATFDWDWAGSHLLSAPAWAECDKARAAARAEYDKACAAARAECDKACAPARAEYDKARAPAWTEYDKARAPAWTEYENAVAAAWARAYISDGEQAC